MKELCGFSARTEHEDEVLVIECARLTEYPDGSDLIFFPDNNKEDTPEGIVREVKEWRFASNKLGFKAG